MIQEMLYQHVRIILSFSSNYSRDAEKDCLNCISHLSRSLELHAFRSNQQKVRGSWWNSTASFSIMENWSIARRSVENCYKNFRIPRTDKPCLVASGKNTMVRRPRALRYIDLNWKIDGAKTRATCSSELTWWTSSYTSYQSNQSIYNYLFIITIPCFVFYVMMYPPLFVNPGDRMVTSSWPKASYQQIE